MTRPLRIQYPDAWYHVINRGRHREAIYLDDQDYSAFIDLLQEASAMWKIRVAAYCLMTNHYHILIQTPQANLDRCMRHINGIYTQRFNRKHHLDGQLFRGRYKAILVDADNYLLEIMRYIHRNPVNAGTVKQPKEYRWSSHRGYISESVNWNWLNRDFVLEMLDNNKSKQIKAYVDFMKQEESEEIQDFYEKKNLPSILGADGFIEKIKIRYFESKRHKEIPQSRYLEPEIRRIKELISKIYKVDVDSLSKSRRGISNEARNVAIYLSRCYTGKKLEAIGKEFAIAKYSTVSSIIIKIREQRKVNKTLAKRILKVEEMIKGQRQT
jgi:REP element-mobilizing transposase RayT